MQQTEALYDSYKEVTMSSRTYTCDAPNHTNNYNHRTESLHQVCCPAKYNHSYPSPPEHFQINPVQKGMLLNSVLFMPCMLVQKQIHLI